MKFDQLLTLITPTFSVSDANRPMVDRQSADFVCDLAAF